MRDEGHAAVELAIAVGVLLLPVALVVLSFGPWLERRVVARAAAAEAARAAVVELDHRAGAEAARQLVGAHDLDLDFARLGWCGSTPESITAPSGWCPMDRGSVVEARIELWAPLISSPWGGIGGLWVAASHGEPVDLYRSIP